MPIHLPVTSHVHTETIKEIPKMTLPVLRQGPISANKAAGNPSIPIQKTIKKDIGNVLQIQINDEALSRATNNGSTCYGIY